MLKTNPSPQEGRGGWRGWMAAISMGMLVMALALVLDGCGGGTDIAGVGSGGSGTASGTVSGFGSVIVDGVEYADTSATVQRVDSNGVLQNTALQLGQRVRVVYGSSNTAQSIEVVSQLVGPVTSLPDSNGWLQVLGQWVRVVNSASDATRSTPTVLDGYSATSAIASSDPVEVFGSWVWDDSKSATVLVATRIEKLSAVPALVQLGGVVQALSSSGFRLNASSGTLVQSSALPSGLANGQVVQVWATQANWAAASSSVAVQATRVLLSEPTLADLGSNDSLRLSGLASQFDASARTVVVQGTTVQLASGTGVDEAALARGEFVSLQVQRVGDTLVASTATLRSGSAANDDLGGMNVLMGVTSGIDWTTSTVLFNLRGVDVQAAAAVIDSSCLAVSLTANVSVRVEGNVLVPGQPVTATRVSCSLTVATDAVMDVQGTVSSVQTASSSLVLHTAQGDINATWDGNTFFAQSPATLTGQQVEVEGIWSASTLLLRTVRLAP
ncbi:DUF5666 domain-containing protein [Rhodoferax sp.]|uniref:DUF5666 domain-containing protein n=1 Tax=Rhodoferax sp. TaxID=50421 RepID=UPI00374DB389